MNALVDKVGCMLALTVGAETGAEAA
jgi:hypothetical protein